MTCLSGRFSNAEAGGFPEVKEYTYKENTLTRGISNTTFRFKEVYVDQGYLFTEMFSNGGFETNSGSATATVLSSGNSVLTTVSGWTISGDSTYILGESGQTFPQGYAYPIHDDSAIVLDASGSLTTMASDSYGVATDEMTYNEQYQLYMVGKALSGTASLNIYIEGLTSAASEYYDFGTETWLTSVPTYTYDFSSTGYTEFKKDFITVNFDSNVPTGYIIHAQYSGDSTLVVDSVYVDKYGKQNAFVDYLLPTGYILQISPDLGWPNPKELFEDTENNPFVVSYTALESAGNLVDNLDGTINIVLDSTQFDKALYTQYKDYYWRAVALSPNSTFGEFGYPVSFEWVGPEFYTQFTISNVQDVSDNYNKIITGTRPLSSVVLIDGIENPAVEYPTDTTWIYRFVLDTPSRKVTFQAQHPGGATSNVLEYSFSLAQVELSKERVWNVFDEFGLLSDTERLPEESNEDYSLRIKRAFSEEGGSTLFGISNTATRELGVEKIPDAFIVSYTSDISGLTSIFEITSYSVRITLPDRSTVETLRSDIYGNLLLSKRPLNRPIKIENLLDGALLEPTDFDLDLTSPLTYKLKVHPYKYRCIPLKVTYDYIEEIEYSDLTSLVTQIEALTTSTGVQIFTCNLADTIAGDESCKGLYKGSFTLFPGKSISFDYSPLHFNSLSDLEFRDTFLNSSNSLIGTSYESYIKTFRSISRVLWGDVECDRDYLDSEAVFVNGQLYLPNVTDPQIARYQYSGQEIDPSAAWYYSYTGEKGKIANNMLTSFDFNPGVGTHRDLEPGLYYTTPNPQESERFFSISLERKSNTGVYFSGQL